jgi:hypothetical protein
MPGSGESEQSSTLAGWALLAVIALAAGAVAWRRLHPVSAAGAAPETPTDSPEPVPDAPRDDDWFFRPESDQRQ